MQALFIGLIYLALGGSCMYLILCADPHKKGIIGALHRFIYNRVPQIYRTIGPKIIGQRGVAMIDGFFNYLFYKNHPLVQIMYLTIVIGGFGLYVNYGFWEHFPNRRLSDFHYYNAYVCVSFCLWLFYKTCKQDPGIITKENVKYYQAKYKHDPIMFPKDAFCKTCNLPKPARSKHCRVCNLCCAKFDHHCIWYLKLSNLISRVKQCVGEKNYKFFVSFIWAHAALCTYGTVIAGIILYGIVIDQKLLEQQFRITSTGQLIGSGYVVVFQYLFFRFTAFFFIFIICIVMSVTLTLFGCYHLKLIKNGTSTNESIKKGDLEWAIKHELKRIQGELEKPDLKPEDAEKLKKEQAELITDRNNLQKVFEPGFWKNLKEVFSL